MIHESERKKDEAIWAGLGGFLRVGYETVTGVVGLGDQALRGLLPGRLSGNTRQVGTRLKPNESERDLLVTVLGFIGDRVQASAHVGRSEAMKVGRLYGFEPWT